MLVARRRGERAATTRRNGQCRATTRDAGLQAMRCGQAPVRQRLALDVAVRCATDSGHSVAEPHGLEESAIQELLAFRYRKAINKDTGDSSECAVCLSELQQEERGSGSCPAASMSAMRTASTLGSWATPTAHSAEEVVIQEITGTEEEDIAQAHLQEANTAATDPASDATTDQQISSKKWKSQNSWHVSISKGDDCIAVRRERDVLPLVRRSFSMNSLGGAGEVRLQIQNILQRSSHFHGD
ncbi:hypothetical protein ABZP36_032331, partial [Zizania latifolia]